MDLYKIAQDLLMTNPLGLSSLSSFIPVHQNNFFKPTITAGNDPYEGRHPSPTQL